MAYVQAPIGPVLSATTDRAKLIRWLSTLPDPVLGAAITSAW